MEESEKEEEEVTDFEDAEEAKKKAGKKGDEPKIEEVEEESVGRDSFFMVGLERDPKSSSDMVSGMGLNQLPMDR
eukprot:11011114-Alexandrium_andersonii.AAC.1